jgi:hypothetical protein
MDAYGGIVVVLFRRHVFRGNIGPPNQPYLLWCKSCYGGSSKVQVVGIDKFFPIDPLYERQKPTQFIASG